MQAQIEARRSPLFAVFLMLALAAALMLGGTIGYLARPASVGSGAAPYVVVTDANPNSYACQFLSGHKGC